MPIRVPLSPSPSGSRRPWRICASRAGSAAAAYVVTSVAMLVLQQLVAAPGAVLEQVVYLSASALAGVARFVVLRVIVFARGRTQAPAAPRAALPVPATVARTSAAVTFAPNSSVPGSRRRNSFRMLPDGYTCSSSARSRFFANTPRSAYCRRPSTPTSLPRAKAGAPRSGDRRGGYQQQSGYEQRK